MSGTLNDYSIGFANGLDFQFFVLKKN